MFSGEQVRFHAAGHVAAAIYLAEEGHEVGAAKLLGIVWQFLEDPSCACPPRLKASIASNVIKPNPAELRGIHEILVHGSNTLIEQSGS